MLIRKCVELSLINEFETLKTQKFCDSKVTLKNKLKINELIDL